ncbi:MAG: hypothetical protein ACM34K_04095, partial [Bacillota bacterium]
MKKSYYLVLILLLSIFFSCSHSVEMRHHLEMDKDKISYLQSTIVPLLSSLANYSLNVHTQKGINQIPVKEIDSLRLGDKNSFNVYKESGIIKYDLSEIDSLSFSSVSIPNRPSGALTGSAFIQSIDKLSFNERENIIKEEILKGNIPDFFRNMCRIKTLLKDSLGLQHEVILEVMKDYLSVGTNEDFVRIPMGPQTAQAIADIFKCSMPTRKIVDIIFSETMFKIDPVTYYPVGNTNELVITFYKHNKDIQARLAATGARSGCLTGGLKKDVVITNQLSLKPDKVAIYGWHKPDGKPIQPLYTGHVNWYTDYSHGIRLINSVVRV